MLYQYLNGGVSLSMKVPVDNTLVAVEIALRRPHAQRLQRVLRRWLKCTGRNFLQC